MPEYESDDRELRAAFESFRADALDAVAPAGVDDIRVQARHRHRTRVALGSVTAAVVLVGAVGGGLLLANQGPGHPPVTAAASSSGDRASTSPSTSPQPGGPPGGTPSGSASSDGDHAGNPNGPEQVAVAMSADPVPLTADASGRYAGPVTLTVRNTGSEPIARATITLTVPGDLGFRAKDVSCAGGSCVLTTVTDLAPGDEHTVTGTLTYAGMRTDSTATPSPPPPASVEVTVADASGDTVATATESFGVDLTPGGEATPGGGEPSGSPSQSAPPSPGPSDGD
ncbi:MAG TPA: hypothetical protein VGN37_18575 [Actinocatenispora sp.]